MTKEVDEAIEYVLAHRLTVCTAESCTAGLIVSLLAETEGCGEWLEGGFVVYSPKAKQGLLHVAKETINSHGLTSEAVAREMAAGALTYGTARVAIANTGLAGPAPDGDSTPAGTQCFAWAFSTSRGPRITSETRVFSGERNAIRAQAAAHAIGRLPYFHQKLLGNETAMT